MLLSVKARPPMRSRASSTTTETPLAISSFAAVRPAPPAPMTSTSGVSGRGAKRRAKRAEQRACTDALQEFSAIHQGIALRHTLSFER